MKTIRTILAAVDFSTGSHTALEQASRLALKTGANLHVLHVVDSAAAAAHAASREESYDSFARTASEGARAALDRWVAPLNLPKGYETTIVVGNPMHEVLEHVKSLKIDLLVAGITGHGNAPAGAGSVAGKIARKAACNVLLVRADHPAPFQKIVACVDLSDASKAVVDHARFMAAEDRATLEFLNVWQEPWTVMPYALPFAETGAVAAVVTPEQREAFIENLRKDLQAFVDDDAPAGSSTVVLHEGGNHGRGIAEYAGNACADLIVIGSKGRTNLTYVLMGSTAERLLTLLPCSLLVIKPVVP